MIKNDKLCGTVLAGVQMGGSGMASVRMRPALIFQRHHAEQFLDVLASVLKAQKF